MTGAVLFVSAVVLMGGVYLLGSGGDRLVEAVFLRDPKRVRHASRFIAWGVAVLLMLGLFTSSGGPR